MTLFGHRSRARLFAIALGVVALALGLLCSLAVQQVRSLAETLATREAGLLSRQAQIAARELAHVVSDDEAAILNSLDVSTTNSLLESLSGAEQANPGVRCFVVLSDGRFLYPAQAASAAAEPDGPAAATAAALLRERAELLAQFGVRERVRWETARPHRIAVSAFRVRIADSDGLLALCWDAVRIGQWCATAAVAAGGSPGSLRASDARGQPVLPPPAGETPDTDRWRKTEPGWALPADSFAWTVRMRADPARRVRDMVRTQIGFYGAVVALVAVFLLAGVWMLVSLTVAEMELGRRKADFAANISHELRTPLALIRAAADAITARPGLDRERLEHYLEIIGRQSRRLDDSIRTVLAFARMEKHPSSLRLTRQDLSAFLKEFVDEFRLRLEGTGFRLEAQMADGPLPVRFDADAMHVALANLLDNAVKFSAQSREIGLRVEPGRQEVRLTVRDFGIGIAPEDHARVFEGFFRAERDLVKRTCGTGIGLALVRDIARAHGGRVELQSAPGQGSSFTLTLPLAGPEGAQ